MDYKEQKKKKKIHSARVSHGKIYLLRAKYKITVNWS